MVGDGAAPSSSRSRIPCQQGKKYLHAVRVKLFNHAAHSRNAAREIAQHIKLITIVDTEVGIDMPDENGIDRADTALSLGKETVDGVFALVRIVETAIPDQQLHLAKNVLGPLQVGAVVLRAIVAQKYAAIFAPCLQSLQPARLIRRGSGSGKEDLAGRRQLR